MVEGNREPPDRLPDALDYAWKWFSYHAQQRLTAFNFYLVIVGVLVVGYFKCLEQGWGTIGAVVAAFGAAISLAFWLLDIRNTELVNSGRNALDALEPQFGLQIRANDERRAFLFDSMGHPSRLFFRLLGKSLRDRLTRHQTWLRAITVFGLLAFTLAAMLSATGYGLEARPSKSQLGTEYILRRVDRMMTLLSRLDAASREPATHGSVRVIRDSSLALNLLSQEVATDCRLQRQIDAACKDFREWSATAIPVFHQLSIYDGAAAPLGTKPNLADLMARMDRIVDSLRSGLPGG